MPDRMHILDTGFPSFTGYESTEDKLEAIRNYLYLLIEELRYLLRHLDAGNFTESGLAELAEAAAEAAGGSAAGPALTEENLREALYAAWGITACCDASDRLVDRVFPKKNAAAPDPAPEDP